MFRVAFSFDKGAFQLESKPVLAYFGGCYLTNINRRAELWSPVGQGDLPVGNFIRPVRRAASAGEASAGHWPQCGSLPEPLRQRPGGSPGSTNPSATPDWASYCRPSANAQASRHLQKLSTAPP